MLSKLPDILPDPDPVRKVKGGLHCFVYAAEWHSCLFQWRLVIPSFKLAINIILALVIIMYIRILVILWLTSILLCTAAPFSLSPTAPLSLVDISIVQLGKLLDDGDITSENLVRIYIQRIGEVNEVVHAVIEISPDAIIIAKSLDQERSNGPRRSPLHGVPILVKDNFASTDGTLTGAGSTCLSRGRPSQEADIVRRLRAAGAIILGKADLSEICRSSWV